MQQLPPACGLLTSMAMIKVIYWQVSPSEVQMRLGFSWITQPKTNIVEGAAITINKFVVSLFFISPHVSLLNFDWWLTHEWTWIMDPVQLLPCESAILDHFLLTLAPFIVEVILKGDVLCCCHWKWQNGEIHFWIKSRFIFPTYLCKVIVSFNLQKWNTPCWKENFVVHPG